jgi:hypothetical protein
MQVVEIDDYDPDREVERERYYDRAEIQHKERLAMARAAAQVGSCCNSAGLGAG